MIKEKIREWFNIDEEVYNTVLKCDTRLKDKFNELSKIEFFNQLKVLKAFQDNKLQSTDFASTTGYGYGDVGRDKCEAIFRDIFRAEDSLVRPSIASGTHALSLLMKAVLLPGDKLLYITGLPYDTLQEVIGITGNAPCNLREYGIKFDFVDLVDNNIDIDSTLKKIDSTVKMVAIQRSTGYSLRNAIDIEKIEKAAKTIKEKYPEIIIMVDNCYGEFTEYKEPLEVGCDVIAGSLIKNPGGGIALSGGYIAGNKCIIDRVANTLTAPGIGKEVGITFGTTRNTLQGLFLAPKVTMQAMKSALLFSQVFKELGFKTIPDIDDKRSDIICAIILKNEERVIEFCRSIQEASVVDSHVIPYPWDMPGYDDKVIMASGSFIDGSSIEISADGPLREPYVVYFQGSLTYNQALIACMRVVTNLKRNNLL